MKTGLLLLSFLPALVACVGPQRLSATPADPMPLPASQRGSDAAPAAAVPHAALRPSFMACVKAAAGVTPDTQACIEEEATHQQALLVDALSRARRSRDGSALAALDRAQSQWLARKDRECAWNARVQGQGQRLDANMCDLQAVADRAQALRASLPSGE